MHIAMWCFATIFAAAILAKLAWILWLLIFKEYRPDTLGAASGFGTPGDDYVPESKPTSEVKPHTAGVIASPR